jgi:predicted RNA-binding protein with PUA-like domain
MHQPDAAAKRNFWLIKFAAFRTSWTEIVQRGKFTLRGVRSAGARKHLAAMKQGDSVLFYRSQEEQAVVGVLEVARESYSDPTSADCKWLTCDFKPLETLPRSVTLAEVRASKRLANIPLIRQPRLSAMPLGPAEFEAIIELSRGK